MSFWLLASAICASAFAQRTCYDYVLISTRGTNEPQGPSAGFVGAINATLNDFTIGQEYDTVYPAAQDTQQLGANDIVRYIDEGVEACPDQLYILLGYSQGASATAIALRNYTDPCDTRYDAIAAVVTIGNPVQRPNEPAVVDQFNGSLTRPHPGVLLKNLNDAIPQFWYESGKLLEVCRTGDLVCVGGQPGASWTSHLLYGSTPSAQLVMSEFIAKRLQEEGFERRPKPALVSGPLIVDSSRFPPRQAFEDIMSVVGGLGLRTPAGPRQNVLVDWILNRLQEVPGIDITTQASPIRKWQIKDDLTLKQAATLTIHHANGTDEVVEIAGAMPWTQPTNGKPVTAEVVYLPNTINLTTVDVKDKIVLSDFGPVSSLVYPLVFFPQLYRSNDTEELLNTSYSRPYTGAPDLTDAGLARAAGFISMFNVSEKYVESYFDPHSGTHYRLPGIYVGKDTGAKLRAIANSTVKATLSVDAIVEDSTQRQITARLPGKTNDTVYLVCHTDGNTFVQDDGVSALLTLAQYFGSFQNQARNKTLAFVFTTGHLGYTADSVNSLAKQLNSTYDSDGTVLALALEHMGTREILPLDSPSGAANGNDLAFTGMGELMVWCVGPSDSLRKISVDAAKKHELDRVLVTQGASVPDFNRAPAYASFGGIGTALHQHLIPTAAIISGPWSLWAPTFGADAIDFDRLRDQTMAFAEIIVGVDPLSKTEIAGGYLDQRAAIANGTKLPVDGSTPPILAPAPQ